MNDTLAKTEATSGGQVSRLTAPWATAREVFVIEAPQESQCPFVWWRPLGYSQRSMVLVKAQTHRQRWMFTTVTRQQEGVDLTRGLLSQWQPFHFFCGGSPFGKPSVQKQLYCHYTLCTTNLYDRNGWLVANLGQPGRSSRRVFCWWWEETGTPGGNTGRHGENM